MLVDNLPPTLDSFCVGSFRVPIYDVAVLLHRRFSHGRLPNLKRFTYYDYDALNLGKREQLEIEERVREIFKGTDVACRLGLSPFRGMF